MALLEQINSMKQQGMSDAQIQNSFINDGVSPKEINEAFSQARMQNQICNIA
jgi:SOS response regulatory protein OraA/RecX